MSSCGQSGVRREPQTSLAKCLQARRMSKSDIPHRICPCTTSLSAASDLRLMCCFGQRLHEATASVTCRHYCKDLWKTPFISGENKSLHNALASLKISYSYFPFLRSAGPGQVRVPKAELPGFFFLAFLLLLRMTGQACHVPLAVFEFLLSISWRARPCQRPFTSRVVVAMSKMTGRRALETSQTYILGTFASVQISTLGLVISLD